MRRTTWLVGVVALLLIATSTALAGTADGTVQEMGWGKFKLADTNGVVRLFHMAKKVTRFEPYEWRPVVGDKVSLTFTQVSKRTGVVLRLDLVKLVKAGPNTILIKSPVTVQITETGRSGWKAKIDQTEHIVKFVRHRGTQTVPVGWQAAPGDKAKITFIVKPAFTTYGVNYVANKVERVADKAEGGGE